MVINEYIFMKTKISRLLMLFLLVMGAQSMMAGEKGMPGVTVNFYNCERYGTGVRVEFVLTNNSNTSYGVTLGDCAAKIGVDNVLHSNYPGYRIIPRRLGLQYKKTSGDNPQAFLFSHSKVNGYMYFSDLQIASLEWVAFRVQWANMEDFDEMTMFDNWNYYDYSSDKLAVKAFANTNPNKKNVLSTNPSLYLDYFPATRSNGEVKVKTVMKNIGRFPLYLPNYEWEAYSSDGDKYYCRYEYYADVNCTKPLYSRDRLMPGKSCYCMVRIKDVPASLHNMGFLRADYRVIGEHSLPIEIKDIKM